MYTEELCAGRSTCIDASIAHLAGMSEYQPITDRERKVLWLAYQGASNAEIADRLGITLRATGDRLSRAFKKLGVRNRKHLMAVWAASGDSDQPSRASARSPHTEEVQ